MIDERRMQHLERQVDALRSKEKDSSTRKTYDQVFDHAALLTIASLIGDGVISTLDYPVSTGKEANVFHGTDASGRAKALKMLPEFGLAGFEKQYPHQLSGGMRQRVALMRTFLFERDLMLLDEPFGALDALTRAMMQRWLLDVWQKYRRTILFITHDVDEAIFLGDRVLVMTARPGSVKLEQAVDLPRPRRPEIVTAPEFVRLKRTLLDAIEEESMKSFQSAVAQGKAT